MLYIFAIFSFSLLQSSCYKLYVYFRNFSYATITQMSSLKRHEKITSKNCGTQTGTLHFTQCPNFSTTSQTYLAFLLQFFNWPFNITALSLTTFRWFWTINHSGNYSLAGNNLKSTLNANFTLVIYPLIFVASIECPDSTPMTCKNTYCTTFQFCSSSRSGYYL